LPIFPNNLIVTPQLHILHDRETVQKHTCGKIDKGNAWPIRKASYSPTLLKDVMNEYVDMLKKQIT
jgi:hypothetical protein